MRTRVEEMLYCFSGNRSDGELSFINMTIGDVVEVYNGW